ncbi:MAG TPA: TIGR02147 family protein [Chitinivibrionales bacterium]|nr:TIGR02147 family protein [Chitinivibrionales bacterium]
MNPLPEIYEYLDYRRFLADFFDAKKRINPLYSYRVFARKAGFNNQGFFIDVVKRRKKLSDNAAKKMIKGMDLLEDRARYFKYLVKYDQSKDGEEKELLLKKLLEAKSKTLFNDVSLKYANYYLKWYNPVVREIIAVEGFDGDYKKLADKIFPRVNVAQVREAVEVLEALGIIEKDKGKGYKVTMMKLRPNVVELREVIKNLHRRWIEHSTKAIDAIEPEDRYISSLMVGLPANIVPELTKKFEELKEYVLTTAADHEKDPKKDMRIYQFNFQLFPRTSTLGAGNE